MKNKWGKSKNSYYYFWERILDKFAIAFVSFYLQRQTPAFNIQYINKIESVI
jgi:hypothetical protein